MLTEDFEEFYKNTPVEEIPWYKITPKFLRDLVEGGKIKPCKTLSLGCGLGTNEVYLAKKGFEVTALDVSNTAIELAKERAKEKGLEIEFIIQDVSDLSVLGNKKFDFILEWALIHCMPKESHYRLAEEVSKHSEKGALLVQRSFSTRDPKSKAGISKSHLKGINHHYGKEDIEKLYSDWEILDYSEEDGLGKYFDQYLMRKR